MLHIFSVFSTLRQMIILGKLFILLLHNSSALGPVVESKIVYELSGKLAT